MIALILSIGNGWYRWRSQAAEKRLQAHAVLFLQGQQKCRVVLTSLRLNETETRLALGTKARDFIDDWMSRDHTGDTEFSEL